MNASRRYQYSEKVELRSPQSM